MLTYINCEADQNNILVLFGADQNNAYICTIINKATNMKTFEYKGEIITIERAIGYGQYTLRGLGTSVHCTDSEICDWCDDNENEEKHSEAKEAAYRMLKNSIWEEVSE